MSKEKTYNLDDVDSDSPTIIMGGHEYKLVYPTMEDLEAIQAMKSDEERTEAVYGFVHKTNEEDPDFKETLRKQSIKVVLKFTSVIKEEFGIEANG